MLASVGDSERGHDTRDVVGHQQRHLTSGQVEVEEAADGLAPHQSAFPELRLGGVGFGDVVEVAPAVEGLEGVRAVLQLPFGAAELDLEAEVT